MEFIKLLPPEEQTCGAVAGVFCSFIGNPLDVLKVRVQTAGAAAAEHSSLKQLSSAASAASGASSGASGGPGPGGPGSSAFRQGVLGLRKRRQWQRAHPSAAKALASGAAQGSEAAGASASGDSWFRQRLRLPFRSGQAAGASSGQPAAAHFSIGRVFRMTCQEPLTVWYSGWTSAAASAFIENSVLFLAKSYVAQAVNSVRGSTDYSVGSSLLIGSLSGIFSATAITPTEVIKIRLMTQNQLGMKKKYHGVIDCFQKIVRNEGWKALMSGWGSTLLRDIPFTGSFFGSYEVSCWVLHRLFHEDSENRSIQSLKADLSSVELMTAGGIAGCVGWTVMMPMDTVKSSLQRGPPASATPAAAAGGSAAAGSSPQHHRGGHPAHLHGAYHDHALRSRQFVLGEGLRAASARASAREQRQGAAAKPPKRTFLSISRMIWQQQGFRGFYRGLSLALLRSFPANAALFWAYENCHRSLVGWKEELAELEAQEAGSSSL